MNYEFFMKEAIKLALKATNLVNPNPRVGALLVKNNIIIAKGYHKKSGEDHAEVIAIKNALKNIKTSQKSLKNTTLFITLEPCSHHGKTPPCVDLIIENKIKRVVIGSLDPNPLVLGKSIKKLKRANIDVITNILKDECLAINKPFIKRITKNLPFVTLKLASSMDGKTATVNNKSKWITGLEARKEVHKIRNVNDAILTTSTTVIADNPELTVRHIKGKNPIIVVMDKLLKCPEKSKVFKEGTIVFCSKKAAQNRIKALKDKGIEVIVINTTKYGLNIKQAFKILAKKEITEVMVESGGTFAGSLLREKLVDRLIYFIAPIIIGSDGLDSIDRLNIKSIDKAVKFKESTVTQIGKDYMFDLEL